jgi:hypothetical protein
MWPGIINKINLKGVNQLLMSDFKRNDIFAVVSSENQ